MLPALLLAIRLITSSCILRAMRITWKWSFVAASAPIH